MPKNFVGVLVLVYLSVVPATLLAQFEPDSAHVLLYFPHFADGGPKSSQWQTSFLFVNPSTVSAAAVELFTYNNDGSPLAIDLGSGAAVSQTFTIPPMGSAMFRSTAVSPATVTGWAEAVSTIPVQATILFSAITNGRALLQVSAPATLPTLRYWSPANRNLGIALANVYNNVPVTVNITALDAAGNTIGTAPVTVAPLSHTSFNLFQILPSLGNGFSGSIRIDPATDTPNYEFLAWTLNADSSVVSSLPPGTLRWPISHYERIWLVFLKTLDAAHRLASTFGTDISSPPPVLNISSDQVLNAFASQGTTVQINLALSELISDSPSELAFVVGHELGHIVQQRTGNLFWNSNIEYDADEYGMIFSLAAGYDPYGAAGALAKLSMATNQAGLVAQLFDNISGDLHGSFNTRLALVYSTITSLCQQPSAASLCAEYKGFIHPHFPSTVPLVEPKPVQ